MRYTAFLPHLLALFAVFAAPLGAEPLSVVTTLPDYAVLARAVGGERVSVRSIVRGDQDAHFIRPKPSFATMVANADVLVATGLDLELWLPTVVNKAGNPRVRSGEPGFVATSHGMRLLEKPTKFSASEGHVHVYGNPHITTSPLLMKVAAANIAEGFIANDSAGADFYRANLRRFCDEIDRRLFGAELVKLLGGKTLTKLAEKGRLMSFLKKHSFGKPKRPLLDYLGGWMKKMLPLRGRALVTYHKNWVYFFEIFGLREAGTIEPKPGIPPSPKHPAHIIP
jgi:ABC-type Zn uptake system ZnuABC Zn-binding protein ZnuA